MRKLVILTGVALLFGACSKTMEPAAQDYGIVSCGADNGGSITLTFTAPNGATPVAGADVSIAGCTGKTDGSGSIRMMDVPPGSYTLTVKKGIFEVARDVSVESGQEVSLGTVSIPSDAKRILVIPGTFDRIQDILSRLGFVYDSVSCYEFSSWSQDSIDSYDYIFFNCGSGCDGFSLADALRNFLNQGDKRIYASDWAYTVAEGIDTSAIDFYGDDTQYGSPQVGVADTVTAQVVDPDLSEALGRNSMLINFDLDSWVVMVDVGSQTEVLIRGDAGTPDGTVRDAPFAVMYPYGQGKVLYTSFHNEAQNTGDMDIILEQMILK